jgi:hypothetical protein
MKTEIEAMMNEERIYDEPQSFAFVDYDGSDGRDAAVEYDGVGDSFYWSSIMGLDNLGFEFDVDALR